MKYLPIVIFLLCGFTSHAAEESPDPTWYTVPPGWEWRKWEKLPQEQQYEVVTSQAGIAIYLRLREEKFIELTEKSAKRFTGHYFTCPQGMKPYLVRALYGHGGTGSYDVTFQGTKIHVSHSSLGDTMESTKSAIIVNLPFQPTEVFTHNSVGG
ncbi:hypothetical protein [Luteolibacter sp. AS25]|uniref:hypothetical protein n=1 Tax=Luteolibacter sp. AS25 TaxID=3135776 RepID=UPI00398B656B